MIIDVTQQFKTTFKQFQKINSELNPNQNLQHTEHKFQQNISTEYDVALKYAKIVYLSLSKIDSILKDKKDNYFSNAAYSLTSFTNQQRTEFDEQTKNALKTCSDRIDQLKKTSQRLAENTSKSKRGPRNSSQTHNEHIKQIVLCLHQYFKKLQNGFGEFLKYHESKKKKILSTLAIEPQAMYKEPKQYFQKRDTLENTQIQNSSNFNAELEREAHLFYVEKIEDQKKALQTKQTIESITTILEEMSKKVLDQELLTSSFEEIGSVGLTFIDQGNKNLLEANALSKTGGRYWVMLFLGLAFSLLFVDFLKS